MLEQFKSVLREWVGPDPSLEQEHADKSHYLAGLSLEYGWEDLANSTQNFSEDRRLGSGAAGAVYKGTLRGGTEVAIKVLKNNGDIAGFEDEVRMLSRFRHPNLVTLLGWGQHGNEKYLVYELLPGGDVEKRLKKAKMKSEEFPWFQRLRVALDAGSGLSFMMNSEPKAFHRDIKPPNILLDANGTAKMADFGLAGTIKQAGKWHLTVDNISGTPGYACPRYLETGRVNEQSEVYSFGTVMLELLMNEHPALCAPNGQIIYPLMTVVQPAAPGAHERVKTRLDPTAGWPTNITDDVIKLSLDCVGHPDRRPRFEIVVQKLRSLLQASPLINNSVPTPIRNNSSNRGFDYQSANSGYQPHQQKDHQPNARKPNPFGDEALALPPPPPAPHGGDGIVLECIHADGVDLSRLPFNHRTIQVCSSPKTSGTCMVGRQHHIDLFERIVPNEDWRNAISRSHFEIGWEVNSGVRAIVKKITVNPLNLNNRSLEANESVLLQDGDCIVFPGINNGRAFLELRVLLRGSKFNGEASPLEKRATPKTPPSPPRRQGKADSIAVLECTRAEGIDVLTLPRSARTIELTLNESLEIGKQRQLGFFENLLQGEPKWLGFLSRAHCQMYLANAPRSGTEAMVLHVKNISSNTVIVDGKKVPKDITESMHVGGRFAFVAAPNGARETQFLEFVLRNVKACGTASI